MLYMLSRCGDIQGVGHPTMGRWNQRALITNKWPTYATEWLNLGGQRMCLCCIGLVQELAEWTLRVFQSNYRQHEAVFSM